MKVVVLHGPGKTGSRNKLLEIKQKYTDENVVVLPGGVTEMELKSALNTDSLFSEERLVIIENPSESFKLEGLSGAEGVTLVIWLDKDLDARKSLFKSLKEFGAQLLNFPEAKEMSVFPFLDNLADGKKEAFLELKKLNEAGYDSQYYITMIFYMLRSLVATPKNAPSFVKQKLSRQRGRFSESDLTELYKFVLETDFKIKSGLIENDQAQFLLVNRFLLG